ncbi:ankyrin repeat domain-containing protein SOWAHB [Nannospalax galili]|uniref:ankyrin repeat domain-containing protein SOWAHB n=1 Tax=Nannospalax galili TaxID=1026970 RepID=UPI0004ED2C40|nr:ankyrin repeat domain-containing protein SOWAHB [Nannospalax galili]
MAQELSQEALLDFLCQAGGRVTNAALLGHFKSFLRDPAVPPGQQQRRRELFKGFVNSVAAVRQDPDGTKFVVLKRRYRDLLGEEGLQRPATVVPAEAPQRSRRRRDPVPEELPAGAAARPEDAGGNGEVAGTHRGARDSPGGRTPGTAVAAQAPARCAAMETRGHCCWECQQNGWGQPLPRAPADPAAAGEEPERARPTRDDLGTPRRPREGAPAERARVPATPVLPPANVEAAGSLTSPPVPRPRPAPSGEQPELFTAGSLNHSTQHLQQQRTREWVARCPQMSEARDRGPTRVWSVLPENFLQLTSETRLRASETNSALPEPPLSSHSLLPAVPDESSEPWPRNPPPTIFRSIRSQLSLQDLDDFVDQESHGSEESSSGPKESPGGSEEGLQVILRGPGRGEFRSPAPGLSAFPKDRGSSRNPQGLKNREDGPSSGQVPTGAKGLGDLPQEPSPWPAPKLRRSVRRNSRARRVKSSSSDEEHLSEDLLKRSRRPPRSRKPSRAGALPSPRVDEALTQKLADVRAVVARRGQPHSLWVPSRDESTIVVPHRSEHRSPLVPLDAREHEWIVRLASGSWTAVLTLFWEDPQLALHRDFLTGYTALHWIAKHGDLGALQNLVSGAQKAGIALDVNVRSSCGYTPLHLAAIHGHQRVIKLLVQRLASRVTVRDCSGKRPWQYLSSNTSGEIWQLLGAPRGKPIFPVYPLVQSSSPTRKVKSKEVSRNVTRKTSLAALLKNQHNKWKLANQYEKFHAPREREEYSD